MSVEENTENTHLVVLRRDCAAVCRATAGITQRNIAGNLNGRYLLYLASTGDEYPKTFDEWLNS